MATTPGTCGTLDGHRLGNLPAPATRDLLPPIIAAVPKEAKAGDVIEVKTLISHAMETGLRKTADGTPIQRTIINRFECRYRGYTVFLGELHPSVSANPYITFFVRAIRSGKVEFIWTDDGGDDIRAEADLVVT